MNRSRPGLTRREAVLAAAGAMLPAALRAENAFSPWALAWSPDGKRLACGGGDQTVRVWDVESRKPVAEMKGHTDAIFTIAWSPGNDVIASGGRDEPTLRLWDAKTFKPLRALNPHPRWVWCARFNESGLRLVTCGGDSVVRTLRMPDGEIDKEMVGHTDTVKRVAWLRPGTKLASGGDDGFLHIWDLAGKEIHRLAGHTSWIECLDTLAGGKVVTGGGDGTLRLWETAAGNQIRQFDGRITDLTSLAIAPIGGVAASGSADGILRLWNMDTGAEIKRHPVRATALDMAFSRDGKTLACAHREDAVRLWNIPDLTEAAVLRL